MNLPEEAPRLPKIPFILGDALLLATAGWIAAHGASPPGTAAIAAIAACVGLGAILLATPFLFDYLRRQDILLAERQAALEALARSTASSAETIGIAAGSLNDIAEHSQRASRAAEHLPQKLQEKINAFKTQLNEVAVSENEALQQELNALRASESEKLDHTLEKLVRLEADVRKHLAALQSLPADLDAATARAHRQLTEIAAGLTRSLATASAISAAPAAAPLPSAPPAATEISPPGPVVPAPAPIAAPPADPLPVAPPSTPAPAAATEVEQPPPPPRPPKPRAPRPRPPDEDTQPRLFDDAPEPEPASHALSSDGLTRLIVTAYIGIGNRLFIRGEGPGLSPEKGVPLEFVSIGKWRWETADAEAPLRVRLFKNDQIECASLGEVTLEPGHQHEVRAAF